MLNDRFKHFNCLLQIYRRDLPKHLYCFYAVAAMTQIGINFGEVVWELPHEQHTV